MTMPLPKTGILEIKAYKGGEAAVPGVQDVRKLSSNETPLGPSPKAIEAFAAVAKELHRYPDGAAEKLRAAIATAQNLPMENIVCGNGSDELIGLLAQAYCGPGDEVLYSQYGFLMYPIAALARGAVPVKAEETNLTASVDALLAKVTTRTKIVFLANPNNPTGSYISAAELRRLREGLPAGVLLAVDAAYAEYVSRNDYSNGAELVASRDDTVMLRTFSKIYGLAALRLGWMYAPAGIVDVINRIRGPFNTSIPAQMAGIAAMADNAWLEKARAHNDSELPRLAEALKKLGLSVPPSVGNFILIRFPGGAAQAVKADEALRNKGLILRAMAGYGLPDSLRLTIGTREENDRVIAAFTEFMKSKS